MSIQDYCVAYSDDPSGVVAMVKERLALGWQPFGSLVFGHYLNGELESWCQAMILPAPTAAPPISGESPAAPLMIPLATLRSIAEISINSDDESVRIEFKLPDRFDAGRDSSAEILRDCLVSARESAMSSEESLSPLGVAGGQRFEWTEEQARTHIDMLVSARLSEIVREPVSHPVLDLIREALKDHEYIVWREPRGLEISDPAEKRFEIIVRPLTRKDGE